MWRAQNFAFNQKAVTSGITFNLGFPGQYYDAETSAWNNGYRDYKSELGRYLESDPIGLGGGTNTYAYGNSNPVSSIDPNGLLGYACKHGNDVSIAIPINFVGQGGTDDYNRMATGITSAWTEHFGKYNVTTIVVNGAGLSMPVNTIRVVQGYSDSQGLSRVYGDSKSGLWFTQASRARGIDYAHEAGHLLGLPDETATGTLMDHVSTGSSPTESQIDDILTNSVNITGCGCDK